MVKKNYTLHNTYLSDKYSEDQQCEVPGEEQKTGTDPQVVEQGEIQQSSYGVETVGRAADGTRKHIYSSIKSKVTFKDRLPKSSLLYKQHPY